jgi:hypothetical protein
MVNRFQPYRELGIEDPSARPSDADAAPLDAKRTNVRIAKLGVTMPGAKCGCQGELVWSALTEAHVIRHGK